MEKVPSLLRSQACHRTGMACWNGLQGPLLSHLPHVFWVRLQTQLNTPNMTVPFRSFMAVTISSAVIHRNFMTYFLIFFFNFCLNFLQLFLTLIWTHFQAFPKHSDAKNCKQCCWHIVCVYTRNNCGGIAKQNWKENKTNVSFEKISTRRIIIVFPIAKKCSLAKSAIQISTDK